MRIINVIGILLFLFPLLNYYSYRAFIIFINGLLFHIIYYDNVYFRNWDYFCNLIIGIYSSFNSKSYIHVIIGWLSSLLCFINNEMYFKYKLYNRDIVDLIHVCVVHIPIMVLLCFNLI
jgi:hypothetical protein